MDPRSIPAKPGENYWAWYNRAEEAARRAGWRPDIQELEQPIPPQYGPCGEGLPEDL